MRDPIGRAPPQQFVQAGVTNAAHRQQVRVEPADSGSHLDFQLEGFDQVHRQHHGIDRDYQKRVLPAVLSANRDVFAWQERMHAEFVTGFVVFLVGTIVENPARVLSATGLMDEAADFVLLTFPKSPNPTVIAILFPEQGIDVSLGIEGRNKIISMGAASRRETPWNGQD